MLSGSQREQFRHQGEKMKFSSLVKMDESSKKLAKNCFIWEKMKISGRRVRKICVLRATLNAKFIGIESNIRSMRLKIINFMDFI